MKVLPLILCCIFLIAYPTTAQWYEDGKKVPDEAWSKYRDGFGAMLYLSGEPDEFLAAWEQPTEGVHIATTDTIERGNPIVAFVIFSGCEPDDSAMCNATVDFTVLKPDGSEYASYTNKDLWKDKPEVPKGQLQLSASYIGVVIEPTDPLGEYDVKVLVHDLNAGISLKLEQSFMAVEVGQ